MPAKPRVAASRLTKPTTRGQARFLPRRKLGMRKIMVVLACGAMLGKGVQALPKCEHGELHAFLITGYAGSSEYDAIFAKEIRDSRTGLKIVWTAEHVILKSMDYKRTMQEYVTCTK